MHYKPTSIGGHGYIIVAIDYFTKWVEAMPTYAENGKTAALFLFNHVIARFGVPQSIVTDHGSHFRNQMMAMLSWVFVMKNQLPIICKLMVKLSTLTKF